MKALTIGIAAPGVLALALAADVASRFVSYQHVAFRATEVLNREGGTGTGGPLTPQVQLRMSRTYGDLAGMGNARDVRQYRTEVATTDAWGFRNEPGVATSEVGAVLFGTSFAMGVGLSDEQTLSARLAADLGVPVYNAAGVDLGREREIDRVLTRLRFRRRLAIVEFMESAPAPVWAGPAPTLGMRLEDRFGDRYRKLRLEYSYIKGWLNESPLKLTLFKAFKDLQDDVVLPNSFSERVVRRELSNGDPILFLPSQVRPGRAPSAATTQVAFWKQLDEFFRARGFQLLVVVVPSQYRIYGPMVKDPLPTVGSDSFLGELEQGMRAAGVWVLNPVGPLAAAARDRLSDHRYVYWRDDTHWTADGVEIVAREIARQLDQ